MRLLIVDDDEVFRGELSDLLSEDGHSVVTAPSVQKALLALEQEDVDVLLTDLRMPRQSGMSLLREVRERWPRLYVVMITGYATVETAVEAMRLGAFDYIQKPFQSERVRRVLLSIQQDQVFRGQIGPVSSPGALARQWSQDGSGPVLLLASTPSAHPIPGVTYEPLDPANPYRVQESVRGFVEKHPHGSVVIADVHQLLSGHRLDDIVSLVEQVQGMLGRGGKLALGLDPQRVPAPSLLALRAVLARASVQSTVEGLSSPIRRSVLRRLSDGRCSFTELMHAVGLEDSPKLSFHLHRLEEAGLIAHSQEVYALTDKGRTCLKLLLDLDALGTGNAKESSLLVGTTAG